MTELQTLQSLPLEHQIGQLLFIGLPGPELDAEARALPSMQTSATVQRRVGAPVLFGVRRLLFAKVRSSP